MARTFKGYLKDIFFSRIGNILLINTIILCLINLKLLEKTQVTKYDIWWLGLVLITELILLERIIFEKIKLSYEKN